MHVQPLRVSPRSEIRHWLCRCCVRSGGHTHRAYANDLAAWPRDTYDRNKLSRVTTGDPGLISRRADRAASQTSVRPSVNRWRISDVTCEYRAWIEPSS